MSSTSSSKEPSGPTQQLSHWISSVKYEDIPDSILERTKYLILDGFACALLGAHLPWSEKATRALLELEPAGGDAIVFGWGGKKLTALSSALINSSFIQGFELDDWHSEAPLHSNSIILPALFAAAQHTKAQNPSSAVSGRDFLLATTVGYEVGPRVGLGLHGSHILSTGWHSGAVFGPSASAASVGKLLGLNAEQIEDALGIACTQAGGLMSAQFESEVKRMQHGFAARSGLMAAFLARGGYIGIKQVYERDYGGFLKQFSSGNGKDPQYLPDEISKGLGKKWQTESVRVKPYASMAATHPTVDCARGLQEKHPDLMKNKLGEIKKIDIAMGDAAYHHGGWKAHRPLTSVGAQMSSSYVAATQLVHGQVMPAQFRHDALANDDVWKLVDVTDCQLATDSESPIGQQIMTVTFNDGTVVTQKVEAAKGVDPPLSNEEIVDKWRLLTKDIMDQGVARKIEDLVLSMDSVSDLAPLYELMSTVTKNPIE